MQSASAVMLKTIPRWVTLGTFIITSNGHSQGKDHMQFTSSTLLQGIEVFDSLCRTIWTYLKEDGILIGSIPNRKTEGYSEFIFENGYFFHRSRSLDTKSFSHVNGNIFANQIDRPVLRHHIWSTAFLKNTAKQYSAKSYFLLFS